MVYAYVCVFLLSKTPFKLPKLIRRSGAILATLLIRASEGNYSMNSSAGNQNKKFKYAVVPKYYCSLQLLLVLKEMK